MRQPQAVVTSVRTGGMRECRGHFFLRVLGDAHSAGPVIVRSATSQEGRYSCLSEALRVSCEFLEQIVTETGVQNTQRDSQPPSWKG